MAHQPRLNKLIGLLEEGKPAFGTFVSNGNLDALTYVADAGYDFALIENEHAGMDFTNLRLSLQFLLSRKKIASQGNLQANPTPFVRVSPNAGEMNQWVLKQTLDHGVYGLLLPRLETVEAARAAVAACRYPQKAGAGAKEPLSVRGWSPSVAARYWGLSVPEYFEAAGLWPLDPEGEMLLIPICESVEGVKNLPDILAQVQGIGGVLAGPGDLSASLGTGGNIKDSKVEEALLSILDTCKKYGVACGGIAATPEDLDRQLEQGFRFFVTSARQSNPTLEHALTATRR